MSLTWPKRMLPGLGLMGAIALLSGLGVLSRHHTADEAEAARWVEHTHVVIEMLLRVGAAIANAESGVRGYASTHAPSELVDVDEALADAERSFTEVRVLTRDNPGQQQRLDDLGLHLHRRLQLLAERL